MFVSYDDGITPDDMVALLDGQTKHACLVIYVEVGELGHGGLDPSTQATFVYRRLFSQNETRSFVLATCCPVFIIACAGPWLTILGGVITTKCIVQRLTDFIWLPAHSFPDDDHWIRIARIFYVLKESIERLRLWYEANTELPLNLSHLTPHPRFFPSINSFPEGDVKVRFRYQKPLDQANSCATYRAQTIETCPKDIVVKLVMRYGGDAHQTTADAGFAPRLRYFGPIDTGENAVSYGKLKMVVMDYVEGSTLHYIYDKRKVPADFHIHLRQAVEHLHSAEFVFGDLREPNIMVTPGKKFTAQLIDFDWAGKEGQVLYPITISPDIAWAPGVGALVPIEKQHDLSDLALLEKEWGPR
ncbi:hypothetical protein EDC04DRAFT_669504 [Pisolithus marmoratus]|nr:hypothetical protein EDC04DRAFT_669504 [Pisolithus marmoratus]